MRFGLRGILLIVAIIMFILGVILHENAFDVVAIGLACLAGALLVSEIGFDKRGPLDR